MNPTADRYAAVLWALNEHHRRTRSWRTTAADVASLLPPPGDGNTDPVRSVSRTLSGMADAGFVWSSRRMGLEVRASRLRSDPNHKPYGAESQIHETAYYMTTSLGDLVNDMLDLVGNRSRQEASL